MIKKDSQVRGLSIAAISLAILVGVPALVLLVCIMLGIGKHYQFGYGLTAALIVIFGTIPLVLSIILSAIAYEKNRKNTQYLSATTVKLAFSAPLCVCASLILYAIVFVGPFLK